MTKAFAIASSLILGVNILVACGSRPAANGSGPGSELESGLTTSSSPAPVTVASGTSDRGGGGDPSEIRVDEIRSDILQWISGGGASGIAFPAGITLDEYKNKMLAILKPHAVTVSFVSTLQEKQATDPDKKVSVDGREKTCRGYFDAASKQPNILCNLQRFSATGASAQYELIHHEFAGLVGIEKNLGASSDYVISRQLTGYLKQETVFKLSVTRMKQTYLDQNAQWMFGSDTDNVNLPHVAFKLKQPIFLVNGFGPTDGCRIDVWRNHEDSRLPQPPTMTLAAGTKFTIQNESGEDSDLNLASVPFVQDPKDQSPANTPRALKIRVSHLDGTLPDNNGVMGVSLEDFYRECGQYFETQLPD